MLTHRLKEILIITIALLSFVTAGNLIPDNQNPILVVSPNTNVSPVITTRFSLDPKGRGLVYKQVIGLAFPVSLKSTLSTDSTLIHSCTLKIGTKTIEVTAVKSGSVTDGHIAYCQLTDLVNTALSAGDNLTLTITFKTIKFSTNWIRGMRLFTATSHQAEKIYIDSSPYIGSLAVYGDVNAYTSNTFPLIEMSSPAMMQSGTTISSLAPEAIFDLSINLESKFYIDKNDLNLTFKFDETVVKPPSSIISTGISGAPAGNTLQVALVGDLSFTINTAKNIISVQGINENLVPGRKFTLVFKGFVALTKTSTFSAFEMNAYYKNTDSLLVNQKTISTTNIFNITPSAITLTANHPDSFDIFRSGLFPTRFTFKSETDINTPTNILLQHANAKLGKIEYSFVAATCDFSENDGSSFSQAFGARPVCFPYRTDFDYAGASASADFNGSGIFFSLKTIKAATTYYLTVWGSADNCGGDDAANFQSTITDTMDTTKTQFKFSMTVFNGMDATKTNESRLSEMPKVATTLAPVAMGNVCWNAVTSLPSAFPLGKSNNTFPDVQIPFLKANFDTHVTTVDSGSNGCDIDNATAANAYCKMNKDVNLYREFTDIKLINHTTFIPTNNYLGDLSTSSNVNKDEHFLYGATKVSTNSYLALIFNFTSLASKTIIEIFPSPVAYDVATGNTNKSKLYRVQPGRLEFKFQKTWFTKGETASSTTPGCYIGWGFEGFENYTKNVMRNFATPTKTSECAQIVKNGQHNFLTSFTTTANANGIDCSTAIANLDITKSILPTGSDNTKTHFKILSTWNSSGTGPANNQRNSSGSRKTGDNVTFGWPMPTENLADNLGNFTSQTFGLFSSCLKFNAVPSTIKSLYASMDIQVNYLYNLSSTNTDAEINKSIPHRAIRLIKLFPEGGVFQDITSSQGNKVIAETVTNYPNASAANNAKRSMKFHYSLGSSNTSTGICLIEIYGAGLGATVDTTSTVLAIWIGFGVLLETDYNDLASTYPIAPVSSSTVKAYGLQSGYNMNMNSNFYTNKLFSNKNANTELNLGFDLQLYAGTGQNQPTNTNMLNYRTTYTFLMGSMVLINGISSGAITTNSNADNLLIPIYCPIDNANKGIKFYNGLPTLYMTFLSMASFNSISSVNRIFSQKIAPSKYATIITATGQDATSYRTNPTTAKVLSDSSNYQNYLFTLRWADYSNIVTDNDNLLYLYYGSVNANSRTFAPQDNSICTGYTLLLQDSLMVDQTKLKSTFLGIAKPQYHEGKKFYYLGMSFTKSLMFAIGNAEVSATPTVAEGALFTKTNNIVTSNSAIAKTSSLTITGIKRPNIESYWNAATAVYSGSFNSIAFFCASYENKSTELFTNYLHTTITTVTSTFSFDFNPLALTSTTDPKMAIVFTKNEEVYFDDVAANSMISLTLPYTVSGGWTLKFKSPNSVITSDSMCALVNGANAVVDCTNIGNEISCNLNSSVKAYQICCYNIKTLAAEGIKINDLKIVQPAEPSISKTFNTVDVYTIAETFDSTSTLGAKTKLNNAAKITSVSYSHVVQENGIGKLHLIIELPRDPVRNMIITVIGSLTTLKITNVKPRCVTTFGTAFGADWNAGDILLDTCNVSGLDAATSPIIVTTKNMIYKCGLSFSSAKSLTVMIWPIKVANWTTTPYKDNTYTVKMQLNSLTAIDIAKNDSSDKVTNSLSYLAKPLAEDSEVLCNVQKVTPLLPGELAEWIFDIDLDTNKEKFEKSVLNEVSIFFDYEDFGGINNAIICKNDGTVIPCAFSDEGILNVRFGTALKVGTGKKISISVMNIINPSVYTDIQFTCTVNSLTSGLRTNVITGRGKLLHGISLNTALVEGVVRFVNTMTTSDSNPRDKSSHMFRITFDNAVGITKLPITIENNPFIMVTFPNNYNFANYLNNQFICTIVQYDTPADTTGITNTSVQVKDCSIFGNALKINFSQDKHTFAANFRYFDLKITNVPNPDDATPVGGSTGQFNILISNDNYSSVYRSYQNLNNAAVNKMSAAIDYNIYFNRGLEFKFDNKKWVIDFNEGSNKNMFNIKPGRYLNVNMSIRNFDSTATPSVADITLDQSPFKLADKTYSITSVLKTPVQMYIGVPCGTFNGRYLINFTMSEAAKANFAPLSYVLAVIDNSDGGAKASIIMATETIPISSTLVIRYNISEPNVDDLNISFTAGVGALNDATAKITETKIPAAVIKAGEKYDAKITPIVTYNVIPFSMFSITSEAKTAQNFIAKEINKCYVWNKASVAINFGGELAKFTDTDYSTSFKYVNNVDDMPVEKNALKFTFTPPVFPIYMFCALVCNNKNFPSDESIMAYNTESNPLMQYYMGQFTDNKAQTVLFNNLVRNTQYKMRCILKNTGAKVLNDTKSFNYLNATTAAAATKEADKFMTQDSANKTCIQYLFNEKITDAPKQKIIEYCQKIFTEKEWATNGCIICSNSLGSMLPPGISMPKNTTCIKDSVPTPADNKTATNTTLRFLQTAPSGSNSTLNPSGTTPTPVVPTGPFPFIICATPSPLCATDLQKYEQKLRFLQVTSDLTKMMGDVSKNTQPSTLMNSFGISNSTFNSSIVFNAEGNVDISAVDFKTTSINKDGTVQWTAKGKDVPLSCDWQILEKGKPASKDTILDCTDKDWCGKGFQVSMYNSDGSTDVNNKKAFISGQAYTLNFICSRDIPSPTEYSNVYSIDLSIPNNADSDQKSDDVTPSVIIPSASTLTDSSYLNMNFILNFILILFTFIF